jgi:hypothetical protein
MNLVEVLVGLTVSGLALTIGFGSLAMVRSTGDRAREALDTSIREDAARDILTKWLEGVRLLPEGAAEFRCIGGEVEGWSASDRSTLAHRRLSRRERSLHTQPRTTAHRSEPDLQRLLHVH